LAYLCSSSAGQKDLSDDTQIEVISSMEPGICTKMFRNLSEKLGGAKFLVTTLGYPMVKIPCLNDAFSDIFELLELLEGQSLQQKDKKRRKMKGKKKILKK